MQLQAHQLNSHLQQQLAGCYTVSSDEPLLKQQACDAIRHRARTAGFAERCVFDVDKSFDWSLFAAEFNSLSLFSDKQFIELRLEQSSLAKQPAKLLISTLSKPNPDCCVLLSMPKMNSSSKRSSWFKALDKAGVVLQIWPLDTTKIPAWLQQQAKQHRIQLNLEAAQFIAQTNQGNLLAAHQELVKLSLQFDPNSSVALDDIHALLGQNNHFSVFDLSASFLAQDYAAAHTRLNTLRLAGEAPSYILWALCRDLRLLTACIIAHHQNRRLDSVLARQYLPAAHKQALTQAAHHFDTRHIKRLFKLALRIDTAIKGLDNTDPWRLLECFVGPPLSA